MFTDSQPKMGTDSVPFYFDLGLIQTDLVDLLCPKYLEMEKITLNQLFKSKKDKLLKKEHLKSTNN